MSKFYLSTAIAYPNAKPHMGHALEFIQADAIARYHRASGDDVFFSTGTDEHGTKIDKTAKTEGISAQELVDRNSSFFIDLCKNLEISYDGFYRTSDDILRKGAQKIWSLLEAAGDIYKKKHTGLYCYGCESYKLEKDLIEGKCPNHDRAPEELSEENYFFRLSKYKDRIKEKLISKEIKVYPAFRVQEILNILEDLDDVSFSRPKSILPWGVEVPSDPSHVMYVWCDALSNYISGLGYATDSENYKKYWPNDLNVIGKDISRFHAIYWPAMLMSANLPLPKAIMIHGFLTSEGKKMSKTLGNVVDPEDIINKYGAEPLRYYLLREVPTLDDGDFTASRFIEVYNSELANSLGNLVSRVSAMILKYCGENIEGEKIDELFEKSLNLVYTNYHKYFTEYDLKKALEEVLNLVNISNKYIDDQKPWAVAKEDMAKLKEILFTLSISITNIAVLLSPYLPNKSQDILKVFGLSSDLVKLTENFLSVKNFSIKKGEILFPRIED